MKLTLKNFGLGDGDWKKIGIHFAIYFLGAGLIGGLQYLAKVDFGGASPLVALLVGAGIDATRKALDGVKE